MKNNYNVVEDIAGNFLTLQALLAKMPQPQVKLHFEEMGIWNLEDLIK